MKVTRDTARLHLTRDDMDILLTPGFIPWNLSAQIMHAEFVSSPKQVWEALV